MKLSKEEVLKAFSTDELRGMLEEKEGERIHPPSPLDEPDYSKLRDLAVSIIDEMVSGEYHEDNDNDHWAYEAMMVAVYGPEIWKWIESLTEEL